MKYIKKFDDLNENKERWSDLVSGENTYQKNKPRHSNWEQRNDELGKTSQMGKLKQQFKKIRSKIYKNFNGLEIKPVFSDIRINFIESEKQYYTFGEPKKGIPNNILDGKDGDIQINYNDEYYLFRSNDKNSDMITYEYVSKKSTKHNVSGTQESREFIRTLDDMMRGFKFSLSKEQVPAKFRYNSNESFITEDGDGGGAGGAVGGGSAGSGDVSGGVAYATKGGGLGAVQNATISETPGDPDGSTPGSGDVGFVIPDKKYTSSTKGWRTNNTGITGNAYTKLTSTNLYDKQGPTKGKSNTQTINQIKDKLGVSKTMSFQSFLNQ